MRHRGIVLSAVFATLLSVPSASAHSTRYSRLTFEDRVRAQESIDRVYYSHQIGATIPFEVAMPRALLEKKVRTYLKQTVALEELWSTPITSESLKRELDRMNRGTRMPER